MNKARLLARLAQRAADRLGCTLYGHDMHGHRFAELPVLGGFAVTQWRCGRGTCGAVEESTAPMVALRATLPPSATAA